MFLHIPKCGGTSISTALYGRRMGHLTYSQLREISQTLPITTMLREPVDRFISSLNFAFSGGHGGEYMGPNFDSIAQVFQYLETSDEKDLDPIFRPQSYYTQNLMDDKNLGFLGKIDNQKSVANFCDSYSISLKKLNTSNKKLFKLNSTIEDFVTEFYAQDVTLYNKI